MLDENGNRLESNAIKLLSIHFHFERLMYKVYAPK